MTQGELQHNDSETPAEFGQRIADRYGRDLTKDPAVPGNDSSSPSDGINRPAEEATMNTTLDHTDHSDCNIGECPAATPAGAMQACPHCDSKLGKILFDGNRFQCWTETDRDGVTLRRGNPCSAIAALRAELDREFTFRRNAEEAAMQLREEMLRLAPLWADYSQDVTIAGCVVRAHPCDVDKLIDAGVTDAG